jgi:hypothetical protein
MDVRDAKFTQRRQRIASILQLPLEERVAFIHWIHALRDDHRLLRQPQTGMKLRSRRLLNAVRRPLASNSRKWAVCAGCQSRLAKIRTPATAARSMYWFRSGTTA